MLYKKNTSKKLDPELFKNPTSEYRGKPFWAWNGVLHKDKLLEQIEYFKEMGLGGFYMHTRAGMATEYLSDEFMGLIKSCAETQPNGITVVLNGIKIKFDVEPTLINNRTMVPMRAVFEALGAEVEWDGTTQTAIGVKKNTTVKITIGKDYLLKNNNIIVLDSPAVVISGRTLVPIRAIAEGFDCKVQWYSQTQTVEILK